MLTACYLSAKGQQIIKFRYVLIFCFISPQIYTYYRELVEFIYNNFVRIVQAE